MVRAHQRLVQEASDKKGIFNLDNQNNDSAKEEESEEHNDVSCEEETSPVHSGVSTPFKRAYRFLRGPRRV